MHILQQRAVIHTRDNGKAGTANWRAFSLYANLHGEMITSFNLTSLLIAEMTQYVQADTSKIIAGKH